MLSTLNAVHNEFEPCYALYVLNTTTLGHLPVQRMKWPCFVPEGLVYRPASVSNSGTPWIAPKWPSACLTRAALSATDGHQKSEASPSISARCVDGGSDT